MKERVNTKSINEQIVLNLIRSNGIIAGSQLSKLTGLRPSTILYIMNDLVQKSLITSIGKGESTSRGGKKPVLWKLNNLAGYAIGVDIEIGELTAVVLNLGGECILQSIMKTSPEQDIPELVNNINNLINGVIQNSGIEKEKILGMGLAYCGVVNCNDGTLVIGDVVPGTNVNLLSGLKNGYLFPIVIENNANAAAIGAKWLGIAESKSNFMTILIEFDNEVGEIGIGLVINGEVYHGSSFCSGELNIKLPKLNDLLRNFKDRFNDSKYLNIYDADFNKIDIHLLIEAAKNNDQVAIDLFTTFGEVVGKTISNSVALLNPDAIIITGVVSGLEKIIIEPIKKAVKDKILPDAFNSLEVMTNIQGEYAVASGAACLILNEFFKIPDYQSK